ncbi:MAG: TIGR00296 family protein [Candidatus Woesearchaeota archaeon]
MALSLDEGKELIMLARDSIEEVMGGNKLVVDESIKKKFKAKQGCFVTLTSKRKLRGCIGYPEPYLPLWDAIVHSARNAAFEDPRFSPLKKEEYQDISVEISVLTVPIQLKGEPSGYTNEIKIGRDGLIIRGRISSGLLLPQVFTEYHCDAKEALIMTCEKAGMEKNAWKNKENKVLRFSAQIFTEENGQIVEKNL